MMGNDDHPLQPPRRGSRRYAELIDIYRDVHDHGLRRKDGSVAAVFCGQSLRSHLGDIKWLIEETKASSLLDYGCGKAELYLAESVEDVDGNPLGRLQTWLGVATIALYDPAVAEFAALPDGRFDGVVSTDVLEHCPETDIDWILDEIFGKARKFVYANIAAYPAHKSLPNGENAHCTIRPADWWQERIAPVAARYPAVSHRIVVDERPAPPRHVLAKLAARLHDPETTANRVVLDRLTFRP